MAYVSVSAAQLIVGGWELGENYQQTLTLIVISIALMNMFIVPILKVIGLPNEGLSFLFLSFALTLVLLYILPMFLGGFRVSSTELAQLRIFGFVLPSKELTPTWAVVYSALVVSLVYNFLGWLFEKK